jgi:hypothetical protein
MKKSRANNDELKGAPPKSFLKRLIGFQEIVLLILVLLSIIGVGIIDFSPQAGHSYWLAMVPVFAAACLTLEWRRGREKGRRWAEVLRTQALLWFGLLLAVQLVYLLLHTGRLDFENTGLIIVLLLALATFYAGISLDGRLFFVGGILGAVVAGEAYLETYFWLLAIIALVGMVALLFLKRRVGHKP